MANFIKVAKVGDVPSGSGKTVFVKDEPIALFNADGKFFAIHNTCRHMGGPLGEGMLEGETVTCPWHGWQYDVKTGNCTTLPGIKVSSYEVQVVGEDILVSDTPKD